MTEPVQTKVVWFIEEHYKGSWVSASLPTEDRDFLSRVMARPEIDDIKRRVVKQTITTTTEIEFTELP